MHLNRPFVPGVQAGFTLIELMIAIAILSILVTLAAPSFTALLDKRRLASATADIQGILNIGRSQAITLNRRVVTDLRSDANGWCLGITDKANCNCTAAANAADACTLDLPPGAANTPSLIRPVVSSAQHPGITLTIPSGTTINFDASNGVLTDRTEKTLTTVSTASNRSMRVRTLAVGRSTTCGVGETFPGGVPTC